VRLTVRISALSGVLFAQRRCLPLLRTVSINKNNGALIVMTDTYRYLRKN
jgi:hypothetical protein